MVYDTKTLKMMKSLKYTLLTGCFCLAVVGANAKNLVLCSPDGKMSLKVEAGSEIRYSLMRQGESLLEPSQISLKLYGGKTLGVHSTLLWAKESRHKVTIPSPFYKKQQVDDTYNELVLQFLENFSLTFRLYDDGAAYRFTTNLKKDFEVENEQADFNFPQNWNTTVPYVRTDAPLEDQYTTTFENTYTTAALSGMNRAKLSFLPMMFGKEKGTQIVLTEADVRHYPNMYVLAKNDGKGLKAVFSRYPCKEEQGGYDSLQLLVKERAPYIAKCQGKTNFPWRVLCVAATAGDLLENDMVYRLAEPCKLKDTGWIKPGKVAWDWWNNWGLYDVPFKAGINTQTYKAYIDFAAKYGLEYVIMDDGWNVKGPADMMQIVPEINLQEIIDYGKSKNVGIILWAGSYALDKNLENICRHYAEMGIKGFKVDVVNRDDEKSVDFHYRAAAMAAKYHLLMDFHGTFKPSGLNRTYPNVLNFEGVCGMEFNKWSKLEEYDQMNGDVTIPYLRMVAGPMDYTQGAMLNGTRSTYRPDQSEPMSQGTRCHQLAEYTVFLSPLCMLCDSPTHYEKEGECTSFIAGVPTVWDESKSLCGEVGQYVGVARRKWKTWYVGVLTNWTPREVTLDLKKIGGAGKRVEIFRDGENADKFAQDYVHEHLTVPEDGEMKIHLAPGGGFTLKMEE